MMFAPITEPNPCVSVVSLPRNIVLDPLSLKSKHAYSNRNRNRNRNRFERNI